MSNDIMEGKWKQLRGRAQEMWGDITDDEWDRVNGERDKFIGLMQEKYGKGKEEAERDFDELANS